MISYKIFNKFYIEDFESYQLDNNNHINNNLEKDDFSKNIGINTNEM